MDFLSKSEKYRPEIGGLLRQSMGIIGQKSHFVPL